jgi:hypothetical protein
MPVREDLDAYARPGSATPLKVPLVQEYSECTSPNSTHAQPLDEPSCSPASLRSSLLKTSTVGKGGAFATLRVQAGNTATAADEADVTISSFITDVRTAGGADYSGPLLLETGARITDGASGFFGTGSATTVDLRFGAPIQCTPTADPAIGSTCNLTTTADSLLPDFAREGKRAIVSAFSLAVKDAGADAGIGSGCPLACGTGDETEYLRQGIFAP